MDLLAQAIEEFNSGHYFECHDTLEEIWREATSDRFFYQGLIHLAVGFYHLLNENYIGAESQLSKGLIKLEEFKPTYQRIELSQLMENIQVCLSQISALKAKTIAQFDVSLIPRLQRDTGFESCSGFGRFS